MHFSKEVKRLCGSPFINVAFLTAYKMEQIEYDLNQSCCCKELMLGQEKRLNKEKSRIKDEN